MLSGPKNGCSEEMLELYALGRTRRALTARIEEHLLLCANCRQRLEELDEEVQAIRTALSEHESECGLVTPTREAARLIRRVGDTKVRLGAEPAHKSSRRTA